MIGGLIDGWGVGQEIFVQTALGVDDSEVEPGLGGVVEEYGIDDFSNSGAEDDFDVRDLLLDETD